MSSIWRKVNPEKNAAQSVKWAKANPEKIKARDAKYYKANSEKVKASSAKYHRENPEKVKAKNAGWRKENPEKAAAIKVRYKARKLNQAPEDANKTLIQRIYLECSILNKSTGYTKWHVDHIFPLSKGGLHHQNNLQLLLAKDNLSKGAKINQTIKGE